MSEEEGPIHHGNDKLFKVAFSDPLNTAALLRSELPPAITAAVDWDQLTLLPGSFIDSQFRTSETDLLFSIVHRQRRCFFYLLFEHQTKLDPWISLKLLRYKSRIWEDYRKQHPNAEKLPLIIPIVLAQNGTRWEVSTRFSSLIDIPLEDGTHFAPYIPEFEYHLIQLADKSYDTIQGTATGILILRAVKAGRLGELLHQALWDESLLPQVPERIYEMILRYILGHDIDKEAFKSRVYNISNPKTRSTAMTLAQQFRQEGRQEGLILSRQQDVLEVLEIRFGLIPEGLKEAVESIQEEDQLRALHRAAVQCADVECFAKHL